MNAEEAFMQEDDDWLETLGRSRRERGVQTPPQLTKEQLEQLATSLRDRNTRDDGDELK